MSRKSDVTEAVASLERSIKRTQTLLDGNRHGGKATGRTLKTIAMNNGAKASELARLLNLSPSSMSDKLELLEESGDITRERDTADRRIVRVYITEKGKSIVEKRSTVGSRYDSDYTSVLTDEEVEAFYDICRKLENSLETIFEAEKSRRIDAVRLDREIDQMDSSFEPLKKPKSDVG